MGLKIRSIAKVRNKEAESSLESLLNKEVRLFGKTFNTKKKEQFYTELGVLLTSGIRLKDALYLISESQKKNEDVLFFKNIADRIVDGEDFSKILREKKEFSVYEEHSIRIGEQSGSLEKVTNALANFYMRKNEQRRTIISALTYPAIVLGTALLAVIFMLQFVVPMFKDVFKQNNVDLPGITKVVIAISGWIGSYGWIVLVLIFIFLFIQQYLVRKFWYRSSRDLLLLKLPIIGSFIRVSNIARFTQAVSLLVNAKVSIPQSIKLTREMIGFIPLEQVLRQVEDDILKGKSLSEALKKHSLFDSKMIALVRVAEQTNKTEFVFERLNEQYNQDVLRQSKLFSTILEPIIILIVGILVAVILIAMYLPMFELGNVLN